MNEQSQTTSDAGVSKAGEAATPEILDHADAANQAEEAEQKESGLARSLHPWIALPTPTESLLPKVR